LVIWRKLAVRLVGLDGFSDPVLRGVRNTIGLGGPVIFLQTMAGPLRVMRLTPFFADLRRSGGILASVKGGALSWPIWNLLQISHCAEAGAAAMHLHVYRDESRSAHIDVVGEGDHPWTFELVTVIATAILVVGFAGAIVANLIR
jgi:hypothetical protein